MTESNFEIEIRRRAKNRLIGAVAIMAVALIILPFLLKPAPPEVNNGLIINILRPNTPDSTFTAIRPLPPEATGNLISGDNKVNSNTVNDTPTATSPSPLPSLNVNTPKADTNTVKASETNTPPPKKNIDKGRYFLVGSFSQSADINSAVKMAGEAKLLLRKETTIGSDGKPLTKIHIGPYTNKDDAHKAMQKMAKVRSLKLVKE